MVERNPKHDAKLLKARQFNPRIVSREMIFANRRLQMSRLILNTSLLLLLVAHALPMMKFHNFSTRPLSVGVSTQTIEHIRWTWEDDIVPFRMLANFFTNGFKLQDPAAFVLYSTLLGYSIFIIANTLTARAVSRYRAILWTARITSLLGAGEAVFAVFRQIKHPDPTVSLLVGYWLLMASVVLNSVGLQTLPWLPFHSQSEREQRPPPGIQID
jgi:hypothetical protein